jgi:hypothetical protein
MYTLQNYLDKVTQRYKASISTEHITLAGIAGNTLTAMPENFASFTGLITDFAAYTGQTITSPSKLAKMMAGKAKLLAIVIEKALNSDEQSEADSTLNPYLTHIINIHLKTIICVIKNIHVALHFEK